MKPIIDTHSHLLPYVDDGCSSKEEALQMLHIYEKQNVEAVICTPHFGPCGIPGTDVRGAFLWLCSQPSAVKFYPGNEILAGCFDYHYDCKGNSEMPEYMANSNKILIEFDEWGTVHADPEFALRYLEEVSRYYSVILAHPERYKRFDPSVYRQITDLGVKLQINAYDIYDTNNEETKATTQWLLDSQLVSYIGSDAHGAIRRTPMLTNGVKWIYDHCPESYADAIVHDNAAELIKEGEA